MSITIDLIVELKNQVLEAIPDNNSQLRNAIADQFQSLIVMEKERDELLYTVATLFEENDMHEMAEEISRFIK